MSSLRTQLKSSRSYSCPGPRPLTCFPQPPEKNPYPPGNGTYPCPCRDHPLPLELDQSRNWESSIGALESKRPAVPEPKEPTPLVLVHPIHKYKHVHTQTYFLSLLCSCTDRTECLNHFILVSGLLFRELFHSPDGSRFQTTARTLID